MKEKFRRLNNQISITFKSFLLNNLYPLERYEFLQLCHRRSYKKGEFIFYRNDPGTGMYFIEEGSVELISTINELETTEKKGLILESSDSFGALSIGYNLCRKSSARCINDTTLLGFFKPDFDVLMQRHPTIAVKFLQTLTNIALRKLEQAQVKIEELCHSNTALNIDFDACYEPDKQ